VSFASRDDMFVHHRLLMLLAILKGYISGMNSSGLVINRQYGAFKVARYCGARVTHHVQDKPWTGWLRVS
jgi:hypothetical protein